MKCRNFVFSGHAVRRMFERGLLPEDVKDAVKNGEVITEYLDDKPYPSFLMLGFVKNKPLHVVVAKDKKNNTCYVVTTYIPNLNVWGKNFKTRKQLMKCVICKQGRTKPGRGAFTLERENTLVIFKQVPADICENCGEYFFTEGTAEKLLKQAGSAFKKGAEVEILRFAA